MQNIKFHVRLMFLCLLIGISEEASFVSFSELIQTGIRTLSPINPTGSSILSNDKFSLTFSSPKNTTDYEQVLSIGGIQLEILNYGISFRLMVNEKQNTVLFISLGGNFSTNLKRLKIKYLIVLPELNSQVMILHINQNFTVPLKLTYDQYQTISKTAISVIAKDTSTFLILKGFAINNNKDNNQIGIQIRYLLTDTLLSIGITTYRNNQKIQVSQISMSAILISNQLTIQNYTGAFETSLLGNYNKYWGFYSTSITKSNPKDPYSQGTTFYGINSFSIYNDFGIRFDFSVTPNQVIMTIQDSFFSANYYAINVINFVFLLCDAPAAYYFPPNATCLTQCPDSYLANLSPPYICTACSTNCSKCQKLSDNCTECNQFTYLDSNKCIPCSGSCKSCSSATVCKSCIDKYVFNGSACLADCSPIDHCIDCSIVSINLQCTRCQSGYTAVAGSCVNICGDGKTLSGQDCDDGNQVDGDGCSSQCVAEVNYSCSLKGPELSECLLNTTYLEYSHAVKDEYSNVFMSYYYILPSISAKRNFQWLKGISFSNPNIIATATEIDSKGRLVITVEYLSDLTQDISLQINYTNIGHQAHLIPSQVLSHSVTAQNNLSLQYYAAGDYALAKLINYCSIAIACASLLLFLIGYFGGKLIVIENLAVIQLTCICLVTVHQASPSFEGLRSLRLSLGLLPTSQYDYSSSIDRTLKGSQYTSSIFFVGLIFIVLPCLVAAVFGLISQVSDSPTSRKLWRLFLGQITFYGIIFCSYTTFTQLAFETILLMNGKQFVAFLNLSVLIGLTILEMVYCLILDKKYQCFGDFKKKFEKFTLGSHFYALIPVERLLSVLVVIFLRNLSFGLAFEAIIIGLQLIFVALRRPYICGDYRRPIINLSSTLLNIALILLNNLAPSKIISTFVPAVICLILALTLSSSIYYLFIELKTLYSSQQKSNQKVSLLDKVFSYNDPESLQEKNNFQIEHFKKQMFDESKDQSIFNSKIPIQNQQVLDWSKENLSKEWANYPKLTKGKFLEEMRAKIRKAIPEDAAELKNGKDQNSI